MGEFWIFPEMGLYFAPLRPPPWRDRKKDVMPLANVTRFSLEILYQNYRAPGVLPGSVPPGRGDAAATQDPSFKVA
ncbi:MAG TPA: hypothetical protein VMF63_01250, partial [Opitutaceae bacterium]|nr:hypothetical protein [Opitutaceae bacterium]